MLKVWTLSGGMFVGDIPGEAVRPLGVLFALLTSEAQDNKEKLRRKMYLGSQFEGTQLIIVKT